MKHLRRLDLLDKQIAPRTVIRFVETDDDAARAIAQARGAPVILISWLNSEKADG